MTHNPAEALREAPNGDRELWRGPDLGSGDYYADSVFVTKDGAIGINCGGTVVVLRPREWQRRATLTSPAPAGGEALIKRIEDALVGPSVMEQFDDKLGITTGEREHIFRMAALLREAATLLESLSAALRPFAKEGAQVKYVGYDNSYSASGFLPDLTVGDFRRARTALTPKEKA